MKQSETQQEKNLLKLKQMYVLGTDLPAETWKKQAEDPAWRDLFRGVVWQSGSQRFALKDDELDTVKGKVALTGEPIFPAHPAEMDAKEILLWERYQKGFRIKPAFQQMEEPVVLTDGRLAGSLCAVESGGRTYEMSERYRGFRLPLSGYLSLQKEGFRFIVRQKWENHYCLDEIELVNIMTPAGIFYDCRPSGKMEKLRARKDLFLEMGLFYPFRNARMRTVNHVAALLERSMTDQFMTKDRLDLLLPHLRSLSVPRIRQLISLAPETRCAAFLTEYCADKEAGRC
jgi:hypothetical protein